MPNLLTFCLVAALWPAWARADTDIQRNGTDLFISGTSGLPEVNTTGELFATGQSVVLKGTAGGDTHVAGFDVAVEAAVAGDLYTVGATVAVLAPVAQDLTAAGMTVRTASQATIAGNARLLGGSVAIDGAIGGALTVAAREFTLNAAVNGDALILAETLHFGPGARILGRLTYAAAEPVTVPASVVPPDRITPRKLPEPGTFSEVGESWRDGRPMMPPARVMLGGFLLVMSFLVAVGAITLAVAPSWSDRVWRTTEAHPGACLLAGVFGLAALFGLVPVAVLTIIGIPLLPLVLAAIVLGWMMGYVMGVYAVSLRLARGLGGADTTGLFARIVTLALGLVVAALLNIVPVLGWLLNFFLLLLGAGGIVLVMLRSRVAAPMVSP